jgi:uncharacterized membrane protein YdbT with pleckstrin-like domain
MMTSYIEQILQPGEQRLYSGRLHWILFVPGLLLLIVALVFLTLASGSGESGSSAGRILWLALAALCGAGSAYYLFRAWFERWTTEIEVTDRRVILKQGFIRRETVEMHMDKVESVDVGQSILGRIVGYGDVTIRGVGVGLEPLRMVAEPLELRNHITGVALAGKT